MNLKNVSVLLIGLVVAAGVGGKWLSSSAWEAQATQAQGRAVPTFEVDRAWPKVPAQWKLGDPSSIAIDAKDNVYVLHRSRCPRDRPVSIAPALWATHDPLRR